jgi:hypothetical protein
MYFGYHCILYNLGNDETLKLIDSSVLAVCLEEDKPTDPNAMSRMFLHGEAGRM